MKIAQRITSTGKSLTIIFRSHVWYLPCCHVHYTKNWNWFFVLRNERNIWNEEGINFWGIIFFDSLPTTIRLLVLPLHRIGLDPLVTHVYTESKELSCLLYQNETQTKEPKSFSFNSAAIYVIKTKTNVSEYSAQNKQVDIEKTF